MNGMFEMIFPDPDRQGRVTMLLAMLNYPNVGRLRDAWVEKGEHGPVIAVYTRNGGGNREHSGAGPAGPACTDGDSHAPCTGCIATYQLPAHPQYIRDADDDFDDTYATFYFYPPESRKLLDMLAEVAVDPINMSEVWQDAIGQIGAGGPNPSPGQAG